MSNKGLSTPVVIGALVAVCGMLSRWLEPSPTTSPTPEPSLPEKNSRSVANSTSRAKSEPGSTPVTPLPPPRPATLRRAIRGVTVGPIENALHHTQGYGTPASAETFRLISRMGGNWVSLTPFGRVWNLNPQGIDLSFEAPFRENKRAIRRAIAQAHAAGLKVLLVPHLWVETGDWRALIDPQDEAGWQRWTADYKAFVTTWAKVAQSEGVELFSVGVELRSWLTTSHASTFMEVLSAVREVYTGPLTYAANWDDVEHTVILSELDVIGINAFYPLAKEDGATLTTLRQGGQELVPKLRALSQAWRKPILFTEFGYTARDNPAVRPWEWPEALKGVNVNADAQAEAYAALLSSLVDEDWMLGFFVWRFYADYFDASQEPAWGFSPLHRRAESVLKAAFKSHWAADPWRPAALSLGLAPASDVGTY